jgi:hypothetical protein
VDIGDTLIGDFHDRDSVRGPTMLTKAAADGDHRRQRLQPFTRPTHPRGERPRGGSDYC